MTNYFRIQPLPFDKDRRHNVTILNEYYNDIRKKEYIILGWNYMFDRDLNLYTDEEIKEVIDKEHKTWGKTFSKSLIYGMVTKFKKIKPGDIILVYFQTSRPFPEGIKGKSLIGVVKDTAYEFNQKYGKHSSTKESTGHNHILHVKWFPKLFDIGKHGHRIIGLSKIIDSNSIKVINQAIGNLSISNAVQKKNKQNLNTILYGPPGTGKTFRTKAYAVEVIR